MGTNGAGTALIERDVELRRLGALTGALPCPFMDVNLQDSGRALRLLRTIAAAFRRRRKQVRPDYRQLQKANNLTRQP